MFNQIEQATIDALTSGEGAESLIEQIRETENAAFLQEVTVAYDWDDGFEVPNEIAKNENCDLGVAITLFWLAEAILYLTKEIERDEYNGDWADFSDSITKRITSGEFQTSKTSVELSLGKVQAFNLKKVGVPDILLQGVLGEYPAVTI